LPAAGRSTYASAGNGTPAHLAAEMFAAMRQGDVADKFIALGAAVEPGSPAPFDAVIRRDADKWAKVIKDANLKGK
jgi:tripartite-type tricarboxylate transporter receptor subunit TctC